MAYAFAVCGIMLVKIFSSGFYAVGDLKTPVKVGVGVLAANIVLNSLLVRHFQHVGIALATSIVSGLHAAVLYVLLNKKNIKINLNFSFYMQLLLAASLLIVFLWFFAQAMSQQELANWLTWPVQYKIFRLGGTLLLSGIIYCGTLYLSGFKLNSILVGSD
jgi:putative peptidoglycan lipid II flippase